MIFTRLMMTNFGVFRGRHEFELRPTSDGGGLRPVVLFGGKNGAGKTTILEAIRLCLYGRGALGGRVRQADYDTYIRQRMHRSAAHQTATFHCSVGLLFDHVHAGVASTYDAVRSWRADGPEVQESITIYKNGKPLQEIAPAHWHDFLRDLIPPGVSDLFFFDGEQIQALADADREPEALAASMRGLLNLDLIDRLRSDLSIYLRQQDHHNRSQLDLDLEQAELALTEVEQRLAEQLQDKAQLTVRQDWLLKEHDRQRQLLVGEGAMLIQRRDDLERQQREIDQQIEQVSAALRDLASGLLPFAVTPQWCQRLRDQLLREAQTEQARLAYQAQQDQAATIATHLLDPTFQRDHAPELDPVVWVRLAAAVQALLTPASQSTEPEVRHGLSARERETLLAWINTALNDVPPILQGLGQRLESLEQERSQLSLALKQVPDEAVVGSALDTFQQLAEEKGRVEAQLNLIETVIHQERLLLAQCERERNQALERVKAAGHADVRVQRAVTAQLALAEYRERVTDLKIQELERAIATYFNLLCRKRVLVHEVHIDRKRFTVELFGPYCMPLPKSDLSAGEKQLYAMALLWALRSISGRGLPIIVDTPMGRLDSTHRKALLKQFFPHASHQMLVLSTDTEITPESYTKLRPVISHAFHLTYDEEQGCTEVQRGYFAPELEEVAV